ncbi:hypothetical protein [Micromonospora sp. NPDC004704]
MTGQQAEDPADRLDRQMGQVVDAMRRAFGPQPPAEKAPKDEKQK